MTVLSYRRRRRMLLFLVMVFCVALPTLILYTSGHRISFKDNTTEIISVGGIYLATEIDQPEVFVDGESVDNRRLFRRAIYIEGIPAGVRDVHTQGAAVQTWAKPLPVYSHLVTEVSSFNMPSTSTVRFVAPYVSAEGDPLYINAATGSRPFQHSTTSQTVAIATSSLAMTNQANPEYEFLATLFASTTEQRARLQAQREFVHESFRFAPVPLMPTTTATTTRLQNDIKLDLAGDELFATWVGQADRIPHYFCVQTDSYASTSAAYGAHVADSIFIKTDSGWELASTSLAQNNQLCRTSIRIDRKWQSVIWYEFLPGSADHVVLQLQDGIYVVEIDDRGWQNVQQLYAGDYLTMVVQGEQLFVQDGDIIFEVLFAPLSASQ